MAGLYNTFFGDLFELSKEKPLITNELYPQNDFYGHATILKQYANVDKNYQIKAVIRHCPTLSKDQIWDSDLNSILPSMFTFSSREFKLYQSITKKILFSIGPLILYAKHFLKEEQLEVEKKRLQTNLLVFPSHSCHMINAVYDIDEFCRNIKKIGKEFNKVRICLYWRDVQLGYAEKFLNHGFECVSAGHIYDPLFLSRLKSIIDTSTVTASNNIGTHIGYCIIMNKPHYLFNCGHKYYNDKFKELKYDFSKELWKLFSTFEMEISSEQREMVNQFWGTSQQKTAQEVQNLFKLTEDFYQQIFDIKKKCLKYIEFLKSFVSKKIVVFGTGSASKIIYRYLPIHVHYFVDNNPSKWEQSYMGSIIKDPECLLTEIKDNIVILVASSFFEDISKQLKEMGFKEKLHFWNAYELPYLDLKNLGAI